MSMSLDIWMSLVLYNFPIVMFIVALIFSIVHRLIVGRKTLGSEILFRWMAFFALGFTGIFAFIGHVFFGEIAAVSIGWVTSPFQYEVGVADLALGVLGISSYVAGYGFRLATVVAATIMFWGDAIGHIYQMIYHHNYTIGNAGTWFWMDIIIPLVLIACLEKLRPGKLIVT